MFFAFHSAISPFAIPLQYILFLVVAAATAVIVVVAIFVINVWKDHNATEI